MDTPPPLTGHHNESNLLTVRSEQLPLDASSDSGPDLSPLFASASARWPDSFSSPTLDSDVDASFDFFFPDFSFFLGLEWPKPARVEEVNF